MVQQLEPKLPEEFTAEPRVHLGTNFEIDVCAYEWEVGFSSTEGGGGTATATLLAPAPTRVSAVELTEEYAYEVLIFDHGRGRQLVAAIEIVSPGNKDRSESRQAFVGQPLPTLPIWLREDYFVWIDLEASYEQTCRTLRIR